MSGPPLPGRGNNYASSITDYFYVIIGSLFTCGIVIVSYVMLSHTPITIDINTNVWWGKTPNGTKEQDVKIHPVQIEFSDTMINDLRERLLHRRSMTPPLDGVGFAYGFNTYFLDKILDFWKNKYNFKEREKFLNKYEHFVTNIQGLKIHFMHVKPKMDYDVEVVPLLLLHGWPGSIREFYELIPHLIEYRDDKGFAFEVIVPSLPGFGLSEAASRPGMNPAQMAVIMKNLMLRLGHNKFYIQGGDLGHMVGSIMATLFQDNVLGFHTNFPALLFDPLSTVTIFTYSYFPRFLDAPEMASRMYPFYDHIHKYMEESGYMHLQATKPDSVGVALTDSPSGLAAYILEKFSAWTNPQFVKAKDGAILKNFALTTLLDNVMIYWSTNSITTSMRVFKEAFSSVGQLLERTQTPVPTWGIKFKYELVYHPDLILKKKYTNYLHTTIVEDGGHFAALEVPKLLADDVFEAVVTFRDFYHRDRKNKPGSIPDPMETKRPFKKPPSIYDFVVRNISGQDIRMDSYRGYLLIIVNVASECGLTETNYKQLNMLFIKYRKQGLRILAFPCNQFFNQEPGTSEDIMKFVKSKGIQFDMFEKIDVNGENEHPMFRFLKSQQGGVFGDYIKWNFSKFLIDRDGEPVERFSPHTNPLDMESTLVKYL